MANDRERCDEHVFSGERSDFGGHRCTRRAVMKTDSGKHYCRIHDPAAVLARRAAQSKRWADEQAAMDEKRRLKRVDDEMLRFLLDRGIRTVDELRAALATLDHFVDVNKKVAELEPIDG